MDYKLGKLPVKIDRFNRTIKLSQILRYELLPPLPDVFDVDTSLGGIVDNDPLSNITYGDCVEAGSGHAIIRFEKFETGVQPPVTANDIVTQYFKETGGVDSGLVMLDHLNLWRQQGIPISDGRTYKIHAYASVDWKNHTEVMYCIYLLRGIYVGFQVPQSALDQFNAGQIWTVVPNSPIRGGHCIYTKAYLELAELLRRRYGIILPIVPLLRRLKIVRITDIGPVCITWGREQQMNWDFWDTNVDEAYGIVDDKDNWVDPAKDPLDMQALDALLAEITQTPPNPTPPACQSDKDCPAGYQCVEGVCKPILPPTPAPTVVSVAPNIGVQGESYDVVITGTLFIGLKAVSFGDGITVTNAVAQPSMTMITATITIATDATVGTRAVLVTTDQGTGALLEGFMVQAAPPPPPSPKCNCWEWVKQFFTLWAKGGKGNK